MTRTIEAVFKNGAFRPVGPIDLNDGQHVKISIEVSENDPLALIQEVYAGLSEEDIDEIEKVILDRRDFFSR